MSNPIEPDEFSQKRAPAKKNGFLLGVDSWIDSTLYESGFAFGEFWEEITIFFRRFRPFGVMRGFFEVVGEGATLLMFSAVLMLGLAQPSAQEVVSDWRDQDEFAVTFLDRYGNEIARRGILHTDPVPISDLPDHLVKAVLATEDRRFFDHYGLDFQGLARAMTENVRASSVVQGGSTITQQLAKNLFLSNERTLERKVKEAFLALWLESHLTKEEILTLYLDRAYMGGGTFGIAAAADFYFGEDIRNVSLAQSAMLAGLFKAPAKYAPHINLPAARGRANVVLTNMVQAGFMTEGQVTRARREPADTLIRSAVDSPDYFLDWAFSETRKFIFEQNLQNRSIIVRTTIDSDLQRASEEAVQFFLRQNGDEYRVKESAVVVMENTGAVRALVGGRDYGVSQFNRATSALRQPGSSFKAYVYAAAMEAGLTPDSVVPDTPVTWRGWSPQNYNRSYSGRINLATALARSVNTVPVRLAKDHIGGTGPIADLAEAMGVESEVLRHHTMVLGTTGMTVMDQATGYLALATGGVSGRRHAFTQMLSSDGTVLYDRRETPQPEIQVMSEQSAAAMNQMLVNVTEWGTGRRAAITPVRIAGKTGTTQGYRDAWFVGYSGNFTTAVWYGNDDYTPTNNLTGGRLPAQTFNRIMEFAHQGVELASIPGVEETIKVPVVEPETEEEIAARALAARPRSLTKGTVQYLRDMRALMDATPRLAQAGQFAQADVN